MGFSLVISNGTVVDGTGGEPFVADVGVRDGSIVAVTPEANSPMRMPTR